MRSIAVVALLLLPAFARADALGDLRTALARVDGRTPIRVAVETTFEGGDGKPPASAAFEASDGPDGFQILFPRDALERARTEARAQRADPESPAPTALVLREHVHAQVLADSVNAGPFLADLLEGAEQVRFSEGEIELRVPPPADAMGSFVKDASHEVRLSIGDDGLPVAGVSVLRSRSGILLFNFTKEERVRWEFSTLGRRLVATRRSQELKASGFGIDLTTRTETEMRPQRR